MKNYTPKCGIWRVTRPSNTRTFKFWYKRPFLRLIIQNFDCGPNNDFLTVKYTECGILKDELSRRLCEGLPECAMILRTEIQKGWLISWKFDLIVFYSMYVKGGNEGWHF